MAGGVLFALNRRSAEGPPSPSGQSRPFGARSLSTNPTEEKINGQGSTKKQPREEETETDEGKTDGQPIAVFRHAAEAGDHFFTGQETIAPAKFRVKLSPFRHNRSQLPPSLRTLLLFRSFRRNFSFAEATWLRRSKVVGVTKLEAIRALTWSVPALRKKQSNNSGMYRRLQSQSSPVPGYYCVTRE